MKINCRQLTEEEEKLHDTAKSSWEAFLFQVKRNFLSFCQKFFIFLQILIESFISHLSFPFSFNFAVPVYFILLLKLETSLSLN